MTEKMKEEAQNEAIVYEGFLNEEIERVANTLKPFIEYAKNEGLDYTTAIYMATSNMKGVYGELICNKILNISGVFSVLTGAMVKIAYEKALKETK